MFTIRNDLRDSTPGRREQPIDTPQSTRISAAGHELLNFCANDYLGLANHPRVIAAAKAALDTHGFGMASVRFVCGTQPAHLELERSISGLLGTEATLLQSSCFDANGGVFEALLVERDAVLSDELNHASIIDGIRLCKATRFRYRTRDMDDLRTQLEQAAGCRRRLIVTDGVFSMDGSRAPLSAICDLAERYDAMVMVDDSHGVGVLGATGAGTTEAAGVGDRVDIITGTLGKALGGASGGFVSGRAEIVDVLRGRSRPYVFSNAVPPVVVAGSLAALELVKAGGAERQRLRDNAETLRRSMIEAGFDLQPGEHPIIPVLFDDAVAERMSEALFVHGVHAVAFTHPVVPRGAARIRLQVPSAHSDDEIARCVEAFVQARRDIAAEGHLGTGR
ncbi:glycine C-acetyltransferase [Nocardia brasiliensis]|uniref:8-amino-7-oxononanoate synthase n=1 Tax=Nocardia brasiliensis (strain ATCC 700358 / HUJEG-1) TaxID=1133849 RepID=K0ET14_NOCB7|nr:glycine C-acetyltransferase [Nocardia brasiliensis]AFU02943.1 2-amino-3-ketobutyrate coenzyme A ligase [Nocardia brasiliensis ATCC 700358]OCF86016.1 glycine C-acetyltransferase [Nocardia brasiliensis]